MREEVAIRDSAGVRARHPSTRRNGMPARSPALNETDMVKPLSAAISSILLLSTLPAPRKRRTPPSPRRTGKSKTRRPSISTTSWLPARAAPRRSTRFPAPSPWYPRPNWRARWC
ncbi:hypothetical protein [Lysobacter gummosus]|uniref:hypothetical protein n=1 Tax=Lysobacter gummosus TaxID=262324 RepID=UPI003627249F